MQELDRAPDAMSHTYAEMLLAELGSEWEIVRPTTVWNENYLFWKPADLRLVKRLSDVILTSPAGGRHATRAVFALDGAEIEAVTTHFVSGSGNGGAREYQGRQLAKVVGDSTIIVGDFNQREVPEALAETHKTSYPAEGTFAPWSDTTLRRGQYLDLILSPKSWEIVSSEVVGLGEDGTLTTPRASDHLLTISTLEIRIEI